MKKNNNDSFCSRFCIIYVLDPYKQSLVLIHVKQDGLKIKQVMEKITFFSRVQQKLFTLKKKFTTKGTQRKPNNPMVSFCQTKL